MADDEDAIYVDVKARLDEASADEAERKLRDKFKDVAKDVGESIKDATKSIGDHVKDVGDSLRDVLDKDIKDSVKDFGTGLRDEVRSGNVRGALDDVSRTVRGTTDLVTGLGEAFGVHLDGVGSVGDTIANTLDSVGRRIDDITGKVHSLGDGLHAFKSGDITTGVNSLSDAFKGVVPDSLLEHFNGVAKTFTDTQDAIKGITGTATELRDLLGIMGTGGALEPLIAGAGPVGLTIAGSAALLGPGGVSDRLGTAAFNRFGRDSLHRDMGIPVPESALGGLPTPAAVSAAIPGLEAAQPSMMTPASKLPSFAPYDMPDDPSDPRNMRSNLRGYPAPTVPAAPSAAVGSSNVTAQTATVSAGSAVISAGSLSLAGLSLPTPQVIVSPGAAQSAVGPGYSRAMGGLGLGGSSAGGVPGMGQITAPSIAPRDHHTSGGLLPGDSPGYDNMFGNLGGRAIGLEGGEFVINPEATQAYLPLLKAINSGMPHFDEGGQTPASGQTDDHSLGSGKGLGVSGGAIGAAESMASMFPGAGVAMQEANLAIQKGGQMLATLAMAPLETMWLSGGQLGAESVGSPAHAGWMGKIMGGLVGQTTNLPNIAGAVQPPKQPQGPGDQDIHQQGGANPAPQGPQGTKDDPMHVKNVGGGQAPPQGAATSNSNMQSPMHSQMTA